MKNANSIVPLVHRTRDKRPVGYDSLQLLCPFFVPYSADAAMRKFLHLKKICGSEFDINHKSKQTGYTTILMAACYNQDTSLALLILEDHPEVDLNSSNTLGYTPFTISLRMGLRKVSLKIMELVSLGRHKIYTGPITFMSAILGGCAESLRKFIETFPICNDWSNVLISYVDTETIRYISGGESEDFSGHAGGPYHRVYFLPIQAAVMSMNLEIVKIVAMMPQFKMRNLIHTPKTHITHPKNYPMMNISPMTEYTFMQWLIETVTSNDIFTGEFYPKEFADAVLAWMLQHPQLKINEQNQIEKNTLLHLACQRRDPDKLAIVLRHPQINVNVSNSNGDTPLWHMLTHTGFCTDECLQVFVREKYRDLLITFVDSFRGFSPLHIIGACLYENTLKTIFELDPFVSVDHFTTGTDDRRFQFDMHSILNFVVSNIEANRQSIMLVDYDQLQDDDPDDDGEDQGLELTQELVEEEDEEEEDTEDEQDEEEDEKQDTVRSLKHDNVKIFMNMIQWTVTSSLSLDSLSILEDKANRMNHSVVNHRNAYPASLLALVIYKTMGYAATHQTSRSRKARFFESMSKLPLELQMKVCNMVYGSSRDFIPQKLLLPRLEALIKRWDEIYFDL